MTTRAPQLSCGVREITLDAEGVALSGLLSEPGHTQARAVVVAVHGGGMNAGYFDGQASPQLSLLTLGASLGYTVLAVDRPGYRRSAPELPAGQPLAAQGRALRAALRDFASRYEVGAGFFLLAHSYGGKVALTAAADLDGRDLTGHDLLGVDISGCGHLYAVERHDIPDSPGQSAPARRQWAKHWGPLRLYPPNTFRTSGALVAPMPAQERADAAMWPRRFHEIAPRVRVPVRLTFAEYEAWWRHDEASLAELAGAFSAAPRVLVERQPDAGHNVSLGWAARAYHLRALAFLESCLVAREASPARRPAAVS
ncbi:alpha/beta hydrolase [Streptomyces sp. NPDC018321]|uniref:alpha/beta hydrolase n=1 Tax=unclassified Streptomyces TaxID=2593676 RepID=UPI0037A71D0E